MITVANFSCVQIFVGLIFVGVACPRKLVPKENFCLYSKFRPFTFVSHFGHNVYFRGGFVCEQRNGVSFVLFL